MKEQPFAVWRRTAVAFFALGLAAGMAHAPTASAQAAATSRSDESAGWVDLTARAQARRSTRARTRIRVAPAYPYRLYSTTYPVPYDIEYPGPNAVRQCRSWLATEHRLSGTVVVPRMECWWEPR
jgi:hypothetical protein